ncbi:hypothetical protein GGP41_001283 [Bipolaris sorokiniana]|uniref:Uncharacterized protein n=1 Tax=Cochliobolus sativus TaxID=45130 RepID=A0A8H5ZBH4_COCSA|nr:hypothetical protein GGP41_001283 [Bipolaris sorokiniana]
MVLTFPRILRILLRLALVPCSKLRLSINTTTCALTTKSPFSANTSSTESRSIAILREMTPVTNALARGPSNVNGMSLKNFAKTAQSSKYILPVPCDAQSTYGVGGRK